MVACNAENSFSSSRRAEELITEGDHQDQDDPSTVPTNEEDQVVVVDDNNNNNNSLPTRDENWPSAEGYTPLGDLLGMQSILVAMPLNDDDDNDDDDGDEDEGEGGTGTYFSAGPNSFVADPMELFGNRNGDTGTNHNGNSNANSERNSNSFEPQDYRYAASSALMALENDYMMTLRGQVRPSLLDNQSQTMMNGPVMPMFGSGSRSTDCSDRTANFVDNNKSTADFVADFESLEAAPSIVAQPKKQEPKIDSEAVQKAVAGIIHNTSDKFTAKMKKWLEEQERSIQQKQKQKRENNERQLQHALIPVSSLKAFARDTPKAVQATATLTRSATIADALERLSGLLQSQECLHIHVVGADHVECQSSERIRHHFGPLVRWIGNNIYAPRSLQLSLVGPNVPTNMAVQPAIDLLWTLSQQQQQQSHHDSMRLHTATAQCYEASYHDWLTQQLQEDYPLLPDVVFCFNAGIWGYDEWKPTIRCLLGMSQKKGNTPFIVTSYTLLEAEDDFDVVQEVVNDVKEDASKLGASAASLKQLLKKRQCIWEPEMNRFASKEHRPTATAVEGREYRENNAWQAWYL